MEKKRSKEEVRASIERAKMKLQESSKKETENSIKDAKYLLLVIAIIQSLSAVYLLSRPTFTDLFIIIAAAQSVVFFGMYWYSNKNPVIAFFISIISYVVGILILGFLDFTTILEAIFLKVIVLGVLTAGLFAAKKQPKKIINSEILDDAF